MHFRSADRDGSAQQRTGGKDPDPLHHEGGRPMAMGDDDFEDDDDEFELFEDYEDGDIGYAGFSRPAAWTAPAPSAALLSAACRTMSLHRLRRRDRGGPPGHCRTCRRGQAPPAIPNGDRRVAERAKPALSNLRHRSHHGRRSLSASAGAAEIEASGFFGVARVRGEGAERAAPSHSPAKRAKNWKSACVLALTRIHHRRVRPGSCVVRSDRWPSRRGPLWHPRRESRCPSKSTAPEARSR